jgi:hypothetical protein
VGGGLSHLPEDIVTIEQIIKMVLENSALGALAIFAIWQLRLSYERAAERKDEDFRRLEGLHRETLQALQDNTAALTTLAERLGRSTKPLPRRDP